MDYAFYKLVMNKEKKLHRIKEISEQIVTLKLTKGIKSKPNKTCNKTKKTFVFGFGRYFGFG